MYKNYIFDLYGTLVDIKTDENSDELWYKLSLFYGFKGAQYSGEELKNSYINKVNKTLKNITNTCYPDFPLEDIFLQLYSDKNVIASEELINNTAQLFRILSIEYIKLYPGVSELLQTLKEQGKKIYLLSNAQRVFTLYEMKFLGIHKYFDDILISSDYMFCKPDKKFYSSLLKKHNLKIEETIMIGNDYVADIQGAHDSGLASLYVHSNLSPEIKGDLLSTYTLMEYDSSKIYKLLVTI